MIDKDKHNIKSELDEIAPFLSGLGRENHFQSPENYFEEFPAAMMDKIHSIHLKPESFLKKYFRPVIIPVASVFTVIIAVVIYFTGNHQSAVTVPAKPFSETASVIDIVDEDVLIDTYKNDLQADKTNPAGRQKEQDTLVNYILDHTDLSDINE
jgi:hypothetical protein